MKLNRRNTLLGIGAIATGGGALFGSGAFSQVQAERTVTVSAAGDSAALLQFSVDTSYAGVSDTSSSGGVVQLDFTQINQDAKTTFNGAITVTNQGSDSVSLSVSGAPSELTFNSSGTDLSSNSVQLNANGGSATIDVIIDLTGTATAPSDTTVTFDAQ